MLFSKKLMSSGGLLDEAGRTGGSDCQRCGRGGRDALEGRFEQGVGYPHFLAVVCPIDKAHPGSGQVTGRGDHGRQIPLIDALLTFFRSRILATIHRQIDAGEHCRAIVVLDGEVPAQAISER